MSLLGLHRASGIEVVPLGSDATFLAGGLFTRVVGFWRALLALLTGRFQGVILRDRGKGAPVVVMRFDEYLELRLLAAKAKLVPDDTDGDAGGDVELVDP